MASSQATETTNPNLLEDGNSPAIQHPLDPLNRDEINLTKRILQTSSKFADYMKIVFILPYEPQDKQYVLNYKRNDALLRKVMVIVRDPKARTNYQVLVNLNEKSIESFEQNNSGQPALTYDELLEAEKYLRTDEAILAALKKRNISIDDVVFYPFSSGYRDERDSARTRRIYRPYAAVRKSYTDNFYAHHIEGLVITVDLDSFTIEVEDHRVVPLAPHSGNYDPERIKSPDNIPYFPDGVRKDLKPFIVTQPEGPSFQIDGQQLTWQKWRFRVGFNVREGLTINLVEYFDQNRWRSIFYRAALSEMWIPYGDPTPGHNYQNAFDVGEGGLGMLANSLVLDCDCLGEIRYMDAVINNNQGEAMLLKNAVCIHEEDTGILWKHTEFLNQTSECRRSRRLVVSSFITIGNYEYGIFWYFSQDGTIQFETKLTGSIAPGGVIPGEYPEYGGVVAEGLYGPHHQHFFNVRIDWMLDGLTNSLVEINCEPMSKGPENPAGNGWLVKETVIKTVGEARRQHDATKSRIWKVINPNVKNHVGRPVGYKIVPSGPPCYPYCDIDSGQGCRSALARYHMWATRYHPDEFYAAGLFSNQSNCDADGLAVYSAKHANESIVECDLVTWYTFGLTHIVRPEDWPVMPVEMVGFRLMPFGFFAGSAAIDVPPPQSKHCSGNSKCGSS